MKAKSFGAGVNQVCGFVSKAAACAALSSVIYTLLSVGPSGTAYAQPASGIGNACGEPEISDPGILRALNAKIGQFGGPPRRVLSIRTATPLDLSATDRHTRCHGTLVFDGGTAETGLLLQDSVNGLKSWRWHSDLELAQGRNSPAQKKRMSEIYESMRTQRPKRTQ